MCSHVLSTSIPSYPLPPYPIRILAFRDMKEKPQPRAAEMRSILMNQLLAVPGWHPEYGDTSDSCIPRLLSAWTPVAQALR